MFHHIVLQICPAPLIDGIDMQNIELIALDCAPPLNDEYMGAAAAAP